METILIVDDEKHYRSILSTCIKEEEYTTLTAKNGLTALKTLENSDIDLLITDMKMPDMDGMELLKSVKAKLPDIPVIIMTAHGSIETAVEAMQNGAFTFIQKPFTSENLLFFINKALNISQIIKENKHLRKVITSRYNFGNIIGKSKEIHEIHEIIKKVAPTSATVLIEGESGTGKELVANSIHYNSNRKTKAFIAVNCAALNESLLESELFGHEKGAFTGADSMKKGRFELADSGTLFLDEIGELSHSMQIKLLRVIQEKKFERVGGTQTITTNFRLITATNKNLLAEVNNNTIRKDLYYRLNVVHVLLPSLRERREDIHLLVHHFINKYSVEAAPKKKIIGLKPECEKILHDYNWPGNVRELENIIERAIIFCPKNRIDISDLPKDFTDSAKLKIYTDSHQTDMNLPKALKTVEIHMIKTALNLSNGIQSDAAKLLGIGKSGLNQKIKKYKIKITKPDIQCSN